MPLYLLWSHQVVHDHSLLKVYQQHFLGPSWGSFWTHWIPYSLTVIKLAKVKTLEKYPYQVRVFWLHLLLTTWPNDPVAIADIKRWRNSRIGPPVSIAGSPTNSTRRYLHRSIPHLNWCSVSDQTCRRRTTIKVFSYRSLGRQSDWCFWSKQETVIPPKPSSSLLWTNSCDLRSGTRKN